MTVGKTYYKKSPYVTFVCIAVHEGTCVLMNTLVNITHKEFLFRADQYTEVKGA